MLTALALTALASLLPRVPAQEPAPDRLDWWREARFGLFIHWGLYAIPAGKWGEDTGHGEWIRETAHIPIEEYDRFVARFDPVEFDAKEWVALARRAGMRYIVITSKHHDGFSLFDSTHTDYDVMSTPFKRDILMELARACRDAGLAMCWYHSIMDWHHPDYLPRRSWETRSAEGADMDRYVAHLHSQVRELLTNYGKIGVMWFDGEWESTWNHAYGQALYDLCRSIQPDVIVNNRVDVGRAGMAGMTVEGEYAGDFGTPEQEIPATGLPGVDWETCMTMNDHWGWNAHDRSWKTSTDLVRKLVDIASKGGNFLLNVGPTAEGRFPPEAIERLEAIGRWMAVNATAIHGTSASPLEGVEWGRVTTKTNAEGATLYLCVFDWPANGRLVVPGIGNEPRSALLLAAPETKLETSRTDGGIQVRLPERAPDPMCSVIALEIAGAPLVYKKPVIHAVAPIFTKEIEVAIDAGSPELEVRFTADGSVPTTDSARYEKPLRFTNTVTIQARSFHRGRPVSEVSVSEFVHLPPVGACNPALVNDTRPGLQLERYTGSWDRLPDFAPLSPRSRTVVPSIELADEALHAEHIAARFQGYLRVPDDEVYQFGLNSDDGSRLWIDEKLVIDNDGLHSPFERTAFAALATGLHAIRVEWFNKTGGYELELSWAKAGQRMTEVPPHAYSCQP